MLVSYTNPTLHEATTVVAAEEFGTPQLLELCERLQETLQHHNALGVAAPQIGVSKAVFCMRLETELVCVVNPIIIESSDTKMVMVEGCLSYPQYLVEVERPETIEVRFKTPHGERRTMILTGLEARCFQHEYDHLQGVCFVDGLSGLKRQLARNRAKNAHKRRH